MSNNLYIKIMNSKKGDSKSLLDIIEIFNPLVSKYSRLLDGEDTKQDLIIHLIKSVNNMPIDNKNIFEDKNIVGYIAKSIRNEYIKLSKKKNRIILKKSQLILAIH